MTRFVPTTLAVLATFCAAPMAQALDFGNGFSLKGQIDLDYLSSSNSDATFGFTDLTLGWRSQRDGTLGFGADVSLTAVTDFDNILPSRSHVWAALVLTTAYGELSIGSPRPVLDGYFETPQIGGTQIYDVFVENSSDSTLTFIAQVFDVDVVGATFKGTSGALSYAVGLHSIDFGPADADVVELAVSYQIEQATLFAGLESFDSGGAANFDKLSLGARYDAERWSVGVLSNTVSQPGADAQLVKLFGNYNITPQFLVGAQVLSVDQGTGSTAVYGLTTEYSFGLGGYAGLGALHEEGTSDETYTATIGYKF